MRLTLLRSFLMAAIAGLSMQTHAYTTTDMHELLWHMFRQHPNGVDAIYGDHLVLLPPQEGKLVIAARFTTGAYTVVVPLLWNGQWLAAIARFRRDNAEVKSHIIFMATTHPLRDQPLRHFANFAAQLKSTALVDPTPSASGPIIAQFIFQLFGLAQHYDTVENMRDRHTRFLQRRRELMTARRDVTVLEPRPNESAVTPPFLFSGAVKAASVLSVVR